MANAKRCDRCGKYYTNGDHECHLSYHDLRYYEACGCDDEYIIPCKVSFSESNGNYFRFELCSDCMRDLINLIATKEEPNG